MDDNAIAIIGMSGRFPGAQDIHALWKNLRAGAESVRFFDPDELDPLLPRKLTEDRSYVRARGVLDQPEHFDARFFGFTPRESEVMDPQQRVLLQVAWSALENAGYTPGTFDGLTGVFAGASPNTYLECNLLSRPDIIETIGRYQVGLANERDFLATRISYKLNLKGPSYTVSTACSTSLVAVCLAFQSLQNFECDLAIAGGVSIVFPQKQGYLYQEGGIASPDGHCRPFDRNAQGTYAGSGAGIVVLKRLAEAVADRDAIFAVIRGAATNNDGSDKVGFTAPSVNGQAAAIATAQAIADVDAETISYIEAHGTATPLGDPIEIEALRKVFGRGPGKTCAIGSIKSNFGHLDAAAGVAGLIKTALALRHRVIPATVNFTQPNPAVDFDNSPFYVNAGCIDWPEGPAPRRAGVSSFGMGGTNAHVVLEEPPTEPENEGTFVGQPILLLTARSNEGIGSLSAQLGDALEDATPADLDRVAYTLQARRKHFEYRRFVVCKDSNEARQLLRKANPLSCGAASAPAKNTRTVMMFPGQGCQYVGMGRSLFEKEPDFRQVLLDCAAIAEPVIGESLIGVLYPAPGEEQAAEAKLRNTLFTQPALFAIEYGLSRLWIKWGITPAACIGHSIGEFVAAALSGVFSFEDAVKLVAHRARLMQSTVPGSMLSVRLPEQELRDRLPAGTALAAVNSMALCVAAGKTAAIDELQEALVKDEVACTRLHTSHAFHCGLMDPIIEEFTSIVAATRRSPAALPFVSSTTGRWATDDEVCDPGYWGRHLRETVRFADGLRTLMDGGYGVFLECGPRHTLSTLARQAAPRDSGARIISSLDSGGVPAAESLAISKASGELWCAGHELNWCDMYLGGTPGMVSCPGTPFDAKPYWIAPGETGVAVGLPHDRPPKAAQPFSENDSMSSSTTPLMNGSQGSTGRRLAGLANDVRELVADLSGLAPEDMDADRSFLELGLDSLLLTQLALGIRKKFAVEISFRDLMETLPSISEVAARLDSELPEAPSDNGETLRPAETGVAAGSSPAATMAPIPAGGFDAAALIESQMQLMRQQIQLLERLGHAGATPVQATGLALPKSLPEAEAAPGKTTSEEWMGFGPSAKINRGKPSEPAGHDSEKLARLVERYVAKTRRSRDWVQQHRGALSDPRTVSGFRRDIKEMVYPIVVAKSQGSRLWDLDGNEYIDVTNGFGSVLLGHRQDSIAAAVRAQLDSGWEIGPQTTLAGDVADLVSQLTGQERVAFCNTGSEAVLAAIRMARTVSGKNRIAVFAGSYHGIFDEVVVRPVSGGRAMPASPGIPKSAAENVLILEYGSDGAIEELRRHAGDLAAVLVEPVQSRRPDFQPWDFLHELRKVTTECDVALIFDEIVTGFRAHPAGVQGILGIKADLTTYGKVAGGGMPLGLVTGRARYMDALDGGAWQFGDDSFPETGVTMFAGTFIRHPLTLAAAKATLTILRDAGPSLQEELTARTGRLANSLNKECRKAGAPISVSHFSSWFFVQLSSSLPYASLMFHMLRENGIHIWEQRPCFLTTAHDEADIDAIVLAFRKVIDEMQECGFLERSGDSADLTSGKTSHAPIAANGVQEAPVPGARLGRTPDGQPAWFISDPDRPGKYLKVAAEA